MRHDPARSVAGFLSILLIAFVAIVREANAQSKTSQPGKQKDEYHRPEPQKPLKPVIPTTPRFNPKKVFLEKADSMIKMPMDFRDRQIVTGNVQFRQMGMWMYCDSAYYYPEENSLDAFGHVKMRQGDTLFIDADKIFYDGNTRFARLRNGPSQQKVTLRNRTVTLTTDSLDYSLIQEKGWYTTGGKLVDGNNVLTSIRGEYSPATKQAMFSEDVELTGDRNDFRLYTQTLYYNTGTHIADIVSPSRILTTNDEIETSEGFYNTATGVAELTARSKIFHTDSLNRVTTLEGDSIVYDPDNRITHAYRFKNDGHSIVITDTARKAILVGGYGYYNDMTREAMATNYPMMMEYSRGDTLFLRADTIITRLLPYPERADSVALAAIDTTDAAEVAVSAPATGHTAVKSPANSSELSDSTWHYAIAYPRARFFRQDIQGVADTITFTEIDSLIRLTRLPIVWNEERQVKGDSIIVHLQDSTADYARIYGNAEMMEHVEEDYYNQLRADLMKMWFEEKSLRHLDAEGRVQTKFLPQESDSTYNRLVNAESQFLAIDMEKNDLEHLKMWPEVSGDVTPLFLVKKSQKFLPGARCMEALRPRRRWYE